MSYQETHDLGLLVRDCLLGSYKQLITSYIATEFTMEIIGKIMALICTMFYAFSYMTLFYHIYSVSAFILEIIMEDYHTNIYYVLCSIIYTSLHVLIFCFLKFYVPLFQDSNALFSMAFYALYPNILHCNVVTFYVLMFNMLMFYVPCFNVLCFSVLCSYALIKK